MYLILSLVWWCIWQFLHTHTMRLLTKRRNIIFLFSDLHWVFLFVRISLTLFLSIILFLSFSVIMYNKRSDVSSGHSQNRLFFFSSFFPSHQQKHLFIQAISIAINLIGKYWKTDFCPVFLIALWWFNHLFWTSFDLVIVLLFNVFGPF